MVTHVSNDKDLSSCAEGVVGCSGFDIFTFKALKAGETSITLKECRLWDCEATTTLKTFNVVIKKGNIDPSVCNDSDNGKKYYVKGTISGPTAEGGYVTSYDQCEGNVLSEWYCEGNYISSEGFEKYTCPKGCNNGACIE